MGYGATLMMVLFGMSISMYLYANVISDPITQEYASNINPNKISNISAQSQKLNEEMGALGMAGRGNGTSEIFINAATGAFTGLVIGTVASVLTGGGFATIYIIPAVVVGAILNLIIPPLDSINSIMVGNIPVEIGFIFNTFTALLLLVFVLAWIRGDF